MSENAKSRGRAGMKQLVLLLLAIGTTLAQPAVAESSGGGERVRVAGVVEKKDLPAQPRCCENQADRVKSPIERIPARCMTRQNLA
jgi:hypothetical protein